jgi:hypothetical protein
MPPDGPVQPVEVAQSPTFAGIHALEMLACGFREIGTVKEVGRKFRHWLDPVPMQHSLQEAEVQASWHDPMVPRRRCQFLGTRPGYERRRAPLAVCRRTDPHRRLGSP